MGFVVILVYHFEMFRVYQVFDSWTFCHSTATAEHLQDLMTNPVTFDLVLLSL